MAVAAFDFLKFLESTTKTWKKQALRDKYCIQNEFKIDKDVISLGLRVMDWRQSSIGVHHCIKNIQEHFNKSSKSSSKSTTSAEESRQKGNKLFQKKDYRGALECYTKSAHVAPHDGSNTLALAHANRSAALFHLGSYKACIQDIDEAIAQGYPADKHFKVLQRKGQCFMKLRYYDEAEQAFSEALQCLDSITGEDKKRQEISTLLQEIRNPSVEGMEDYLRALDLPSYNTDGIPDEEIKETSSRLMKASSAIILQHQEGKGRYLETTRDIAPGELLIKEKPFAAIILKEEEIYHCHYCFVQCSPIPCPNCICARYCSPTCRTECWNQYHQIECGLQDLLQQVSVFSQLSLRILITAGREALSEHIHKPSSSTSSSEGATGATSSTTTQASSYSCFDDGSMVDYQAIVGLEAHWFNHSHLELLQYAVTSIFLAKCFYQNLVLPETLGRFSEEELITEIASLLLLHTRQLKSNSHAITEVRSSEGGNTAQKSAGGTVQEISQVRVATAVYPTVSLMNHACQPNVIASFKGNVVSVRATEKIMCGDEIQHCYGPQVSHMTMSDRQQALLEQYCFTCQCRACRADTKPCDQDEDFGIKCPDDGQPIDFKTSKCTKCAKGWDLVQLIKKSSAATSRLSELRKEYSSAENDKALMRGVICETRSCIDVLDRILVPPDRITAQSYDFLAKCYVAIDEYKKASFWLAKSMPTVEWQYGRDSIEVANELFKLAQLYFNGEEFKPAMEVIDRALELFTRHYGNNNDEVMELMQMKACLMTL